MGPLNPALDDFERAVRALAGHPSIHACIKGNELVLGMLSRAVVKELIRTDAGRYLLMAAAGLNRTSLKRAVEIPEIQLVSPQMRRAQVILDALPTRILFETAISQAIMLRSGDLHRRRTGSVEATFRDRIADEGVPLAMSPPIRHVPGLLVAKRKPDGVYPDPATGLPPKLYLEIKNVRRVSDDIQKRLYELAEASLEMKMLYGRLRLNGLDVQSLEDARADASLRGQVRKQIVGVRPVVVGFFICPKIEAERYREGAEAFVDRVFFQEEVEDCIRFLRDVIDDG